MIVTLLLNNPPGGRCRLYRAYAAVLTEHAGAHCVESFENPPTQPGVRPPAVLIDGCLVAPADGVIVAPEDIARVLGPDRPDAPRIMALLEDAVEAQAREWS
ncbi:MAG: hypothetical protein M0Z76_07525 [Gammaproteobacteria bacterium]|nr:hypothetical protein [Gammaproteobacteria bacterium]